MSAVVAGGSTRGTGVMVSASRRIRSTGACVPARQMSTRHGRQRRASCPAMQHVKWQQRMLYCRVACAAVSVRVRVAQHELSDILPEIVISEVKTLVSDKETPSNSVNNAITSCSATSTVESNVISTPEFKKITASLSNDIQITPLPKGVDVKEEPNETDEPLSKVKSNVSITPARIPYVDSDDEDDKPLSKMIGHPNDDQLRALVTKIVKESKLEDITMKTVIRKVFDAYPNFDLGYRKEFIKSIVRQVGKISMTNSTAAGHPSSMMVLDSIQQQNYRPLLPHVVIYIRLVLNFASLFSFKLERAFAESCNFEKLNGDNYKQWKFNIKMQLLNLELIEFVDKQEPVLDAEAKKS
ncbi:hypothetical protein AVEN_122753-1 [Araneus ventricosus]|uniref:DEK-C domain-containing protein n=1 Tax=Araneus ventricosus TaxID=182803 RepID=A0A4Y2MTW6_ARAVE|nr:hypothetical protein AVEN_122753-1 [Araneus ventricosus]